MARPVKDGLDYFPLNVVLDEKFELLEADYGLKAFAIVIKLYMKIYQHGYYCEWNTDVMLLFARKNGVGANVVSEIVNAAVARKIFDAAMYKKYGILTSHGIQQQYCKSKRGGFERIDKSHLLISAPQKEVLTEETGVNTVKTGVNTVKTTQRKEEERKENKNKIKKNTFLENNRHYDDEELEKFINAGLDEE